MSGKIRQLPRLEVHSHSYVSGPLQGSRYRDGIWTTDTFTHSHEGGSVPHYHPDTGPAHFIGRGSKKGPKFVAKPTGPQLDYIERTQEQSILRVIFVDEYTSAHASAGISRERWEGERAVFVAHMQSPAVARMVNEFGLTPRYILDNPREA